MQVLGSYSEEGDVEGLNFVNGTVKKINSDKYFKVPHMGWNKVDTKNNDLEPLSKPVKGYHGRDLFFLHPKKMMNTLFEILSKN